MANTVDKALKIAEAEVGYLEKSARAYKANPNVLDSKADGAGYDNYTKYGRDMHKLYPSVMDFPAAWCDCFVDWCFQKAYGVTTAKSLLGGNFDDYTVASAAMYEKKGALYTTPKVGDQVFFTKNGKPSGCYHTGIVYKVDGLYFYTIEGNTSTTVAVEPNGGAVCKKAYGIKSYTGRVIFGRPKYDKDNKKGYSGQWPTIPLRGFFVKGDSTPECLKLKKFLNWYGDYKLKMDNTLRDKSIKAVKDFQLREGLVDDGEFGPKSLEAAKKVKK